jgi:hypothetical protein
MKKIFVLVALLSNVILSNAGNTEKSLSENNAENMYWHAVNLYNDQKFSKAVLYFTFLMENSSENPEYCYYTGMCYYHLNKPKIAKYFFNQVEDNNAYVLKIKFLSRIENRDGMEIPEGF